MSYFKKNHNVIQNIVKRELVVTKGSDSYSRFRNSFIQNILIEIMNRPEEWDDNIVVTTDNYIEKFDSLISNMMKKDKITDDQVLDEELDELFISCLAFFIEMEISDFEYDYSDTNSIKNSVLKKIDEAKPHVREKTNLLCLGLASHIYSNKLKNIPMKDIKEFSNNLDEFKVIKGQVDALQATLKEQKISFNFTGLYNGFDQLRKKKVFESNLLLAGLFFLGFNILYAVIPQGYFETTNNIPTVISGLDKNIVAETKNSDSNVSDKNKGEQAIGGNPPLEAQSIFSIAKQISTVIVLIYFFRIFLHNHKSVKMQLLQIDLRLTFCQFIENYCDFAKKKKDDGIELEMFEKVLFAGIVADDSKIPSTFDGLDQISNLAKVIRGNSKTSTS